MSNERLEDLVRFYLILDRLERNIGGTRTLADCRGRMDWPERVFISSGNRMKTGRTQVRVRES